MSPEAGVVAILHLSAVVAVLTAAYVGIDRVQEDRDHLPKHLGEAAEIAKEVAMRLGLVNVDGSVLRPSGKWRYLRANYPASVILYIANFPADFGKFHRIGQFIYRQRHIPFLGYFRRRLHLYVVGILAVCSIAIFFVATATLIWNFAYFQTADVLKVSYFVLAVAALWVLTTGCCSFMLKKDRLKNLCVEFEKLTESRLKAIRDKATKTVQEFQQ